MGFTGDGGMYRGISSLELLGLCSKSVRMVRPPESVMKLFGSWSERRERDVSGSYIWITSDVFRRSVCKSDVVMW